MHNRPLAFLGFALVVGAQVTVLLFGEAAIGSWSGAVRVFGISAAGICLVVGGLFRETAVGSADVPWFRWVGLAHFLVGGGFLLAASVDFLAGAGGGIDLFVGTVVGVTLLVVGRDVYRGGVYVDLRRLEGSKG